MSISRAELGARLVEVATRSRAGTGYELATGFAVSADLVLTVRHGLVRSGPIDHVQVRFLGEGWQPVGSAWNASDEAEAPLDAALLRLGMHRSFDAPMRWGLGDYQRGGRVPCSGVGFPGLGHTSQDGLGVTSESIGIAGHLDPLGGLKGDRHQLTLDAGAPRPELWQGLSGGPIFVDGELVGIVLSAMASGTHLWVTPLSRLRAIPEFVRLVGLEAPAESTSRAAEVRRLGEAPAEVAPAEPVAVIPEPAPAIPNYARADLRALRDRPRHDLQEREYTAMVRGLGSFDRHENPEGRGPGSKLRAIELDGDAVVLDPTTGLMWTRGVSDEVPGDEREEQAEELNDLGFAGFEDWRLPTIEEAVSLLRPARRGVYLDPVFEEPKRWVWTCDTDGRRAWVVLTAHGYANASAVTGAGVRGVRRLAAEESYDEPEPEPDASSLVLRATPRTELDEEAVLEAARVHGFYTSHGGAPEGFVARSLVTIEREGQSLVIDRRAGLMWQCGGSRRKLPSAKVEAQVRGLVRKRHGGFEDWRLPTVEEALSLLVPTRLGGRHLDLVFESSINATWTCDLDPKGQRWVVSFESANASPRWSIFDQYLRAVRTMTPDE